MNTSAKKEEASMDAAFAIELSRHGLLHSLIENGIPREIVRRCFGLGYCAGIEYAFNRAVDELHEMVKGK